MKSSQVTAKECLASEVGLFSRRRPVDDLPARIAGFWLWWDQSGRSQAERTITGDLTAEDFAENMTRSLHAVGDLSWELAPGKVTKHLLVITPEGQAPKRALARRMIAAAPAADQSWSFTDTRPPVGDPESVTLGVEGAPEVRFADVSVSARRVGARFDVSVHHPEFASLPHEARQTITMLALDAALGEIATELWVGDIKVSDVPPLDGFGLSALRSVITDHAASWTNADGAPGWVMLEGETPQGPVLATAQVPLHPATAPTFETHVALTLPYAYRTERGYPAEESLEALRAAEDRLSAALGPNGRLVAHQSCAGQRTLHYYVDNTVPGVLDLIREVARSWGEGRASVIDTPDPAWNSTAHLRQ